MSRPENHHRSISLSLSNCALLAHQSMTKPLSACPGQVISCAGQAGLPGNLPTGQVKLSPRFYKCSHLVTSHYDIPSLSEDDCLSLFTIRETSGPKPQFAPETSWKFLFRRDLHICPIFYQAFQLSSSMNFQGFFSYYPQLSLFTLLFSAKFLLHFASVVPEHREHDLPLPWLK